MKKIPTTLLLIFVASITILPLGFIFLQPIFSSTQSGQNLAQLFASSYLQTTLRNTIIMSTGAMIFTIMLGVPLAWILTRTNLPHRKKLRTLFMMPYIIPPYIGAIAWIDLANPNVGLLNRLIGASFFDIYSLGGMIWVLGLFYYTFVLLGVSTALENMDPSLEESARMCGASPWRVAWDISLPLVRPAILSTGFLVFIASAAAFGVPYLVGGSRNIPVLTGVIYEKVRTGGLNGIFEASNIAVPLLALAVIALIAIERLSKNQGFAVVGGKSAMATTIDLDRFRQPIFRLCIGLLFMIVILPLAAITISSFLEIPGRFDSFSFFHYREVFGGRHSISNALLNSLILAGGAATLAIAIGGIVGYLRAKNNTFVTRTTDLFLSIPYATPGVIIALGLILAFSRGIRLTDTLWILLIAYFVKYASFVVRTVAPNTQQIDPSLAEAAQMCGAGPFRRMLTIWIPLLKPALIAGWFLVFMPAFSELTMSILLVGINTDTIGTIIFRLQDYVNPDAAPVVAILVVALVVASNAITKALTKGKYGI
jgi:iron(III) transport system permease protein